MITEAVLKALHIGIIVIILWIGEYYSIFPCWILQELVII